LSEIDVSVGTVTYPPGGTLGPRTQRDLQPTPAHLIRSFRAEHGTTPMAYLWDRRAALAVDLLANTGLSIAAIAGRCGFKSAHHLSRRVKRSAGMPPAALRRARWDAAYSSSSSSEV
jgi:AraC-like DNA-binding protein